MQASADEPVAAGWPALSPRRWRICLVGETGSGKTTTAAVLAESLTAAGHRSQVIALAALLHSLQNRLYHEIAEPKPSDQQDQQLMLDLAKHIRRIRPTALVERFEQTLTAVPAGTVVINADLRDHLVDAPRLRELGFYFVRVRCDRSVRQQRLRARNDLSIVDDEQVFALDEIACDVEFDNNRDGIEHVREFCAELLAGVLCC
jgi:dephospho-CoA kinase